MSQENPLQRLYDECRHRVAQHEESIIRHLRIAAAMDRVDIRSSAPRSVADNFARKLVRARFELTEIIRALADVTTPLGVDAELAAVLATTLRAKFRPRYASPGRHQGTGRMSDADHIRSQRRERKNRYDRALRRVSEESIEAELVAASDGLDEIEWEDVAMETLRELQMIREEIQHDGESRATKRARAAKRRALRQELKWLGVPVKPAETDE